MKIDKVIHASDDKAFYLDFWPIVSKIWKKKFQVEPVLLYFGNGNPSTEFGTVIKMPIIPGVPVNTQCQISRYWIPSTDLDATWMTSDIDMLPISRHYFLGWPLDVPDDKWLHLNADPGEHHPNIVYLCCYNVAKGRTFKEILELPESFEEFVKKEFWKENSHNYTPNGLSHALPHWGADEMWSSRMLNRFSDQSRIVRQFRDCGPHGCHRIDRLNWEWDESQVISEDYYDCHAIRPYSKHKDSIDKLTNLILKNV